MCTGVFVCAGGTALLLHPTVRLIYCFSPPSLSLQIDLEPEGKVYVVIDLSGSSTEGKTKKLKKKQQKNNTTRLFVFWVKRTEITHGYAQENVVRWCEAESTAMPHAKPTLMSLERWNYFKIISCVGRPSTSTTAANIMNSSHLKLQ